MTGMTMTGGLLISLYLFTLAGFLGLDVIRKVPPTLYGALAAVLGAAAAIAVAAAVAGAMGGGENSAVVLSTVAAAVATTGVVAGLWRAKRMLRQGGAKR